MRTTLEASGSVPAAVAAVGLVVAAAYGLGRLIVRGPASGGRSSDTRLIAVAVGLNLVATLGAALGSMRLLAGNRPAWLLVGLALLGIVVAWGKRRTRLPAFRSALCRNRLSWPLRWLAIGMALVTLGPALAYPTGWDELVYHHELPRRWHADGWPAFYPDLPYSGFPSLGEILFWLMAPIDGVIAPRLLMWVCWLLGLAMVYRSLAVRLRANAAMVLALALALSSAVLLISANCYVECLTLMNVAAIWLVIGESDGSWLTRTTNGSYLVAIVLGILAGGTAAVKLTGLAIALIPFAWYCRQLWLDQRRAAEIAQQLVVYLLVALSMALPFYLRPWLLTGNPFYPYYEAWFSADPANLEMSRFHHALGSAFGIGGLAGFFGGPLFLALANEIYDGSFGWQLVIVIGLAALALKTAVVEPRRRGLLWPAAVFVGLYLFWFFTAQQARFALGAIVALLLVAAGGLAKLHGRQRQIVLLLLFAATLISLPWRTDGHYFGSWLAALGVIREVDYANVSTDGNQTYLPLIEAIAEQTPPDARLMLFFEHRGFYLPRAHVIGTPFFQAAYFTPPERFADLQSILDELARERVTHVVVSKTPSGPDVLAGWLERTESFFSALDQGIQQGRLARVWESERYALYEVRRSDGQAIEVIP